MREPNLLAKQFARELGIVRAARDRDHAKAEAAENLHVSTTGAGLTLLYENLRNASENAEENLLLQRAIKRFFKRVYLTPDINNLKDIGSELVTELTLAGYLKNDSVSIDTVNQISQIAIDYTKLRNKLISRFPGNTVERWTTEPMSAAIESKLLDHRLSLAFADFAYSYFLSAIDVNSFFGGKRPNSYEATLFVAVCSALLKSDPSAIRLSLLTRYQISLAKAPDFAKFNMQIDQVFNSSALKRLVHLIDRHGAAFRIILRAMNSNDKLDQHLLSEKSFLGPYDAAISESYTTISRNINRGIVRSVIFLVITKFIIGIAAEVPYDLMIHGKVIWLALIVNLFTPPLYMIALRLTLSMPNPSNTRALHREAVRILYEPVPTKPFLGRRTGNKFGKGYNAIYSLLVIVVFAGVAYALVRFARFEWVHLIIFFVFISTASFLGFRLSRSIREIEVGEEAQTGVTTVRDFFYMPFVAVGRRISETYAQINIVSRMLDMLVELPLKTILGFLRKWGSFLSAKKDSF